MSIKKKVRKKIFEKFPKIVTENPYKLIALVIVFTIFMGYFASFAEMETDEETFEPDTGKAEWMDQVEDRFGSQGEIVQIVHISDKGDTLSQEVLMDMLDTKEALMQDELIESTLMDTDEFPDGILTLADLIIQANQSIELTDSLAEMDENLQTFQSSLKNQTEMYGKLHSSLQNNQILANSTNLAIREEAAEIFRSKSNIVSNPESWEVLVEYFELYETLLDLIKEEVGDPIDEPITDPVSVEEHEFEGTGKLCSENEAFMEENGENETLPEEGEYFLEMFTASLRIMVNEESTLEERMATVELLNEFLEVGEHIAYIQPDFEVVEGIPSIELSHREMVENLENMSDRDVKRTLKDLHEYDPEPLEKSLERSEAILDSAGVYTEKASDNLNSTDRSLVELQSTFEEKDNIEKEQTWRYYRNYSKTLGIRFRLDRSEFEDLLDEGLMPDPLIQEFEKEGYVFDERPYLYKDGYIWRVEVEGEENFTIEKAGEKLRVNRGGYFELLRGTTRVITEMTDLIGAAEYLPGVLEELSRTTVDFTSEEFEAEDLTIRRIRATSGMSLLQMDTGVDSDTRLEAQEKVIDISEETSESSETKVFAPEVMLDEINESALRSIGQLLPMAFVFVVVVLMLVYKSVMETILSLSALGIAITWTFGAGVLLGYKFNPLIVAVPILITGLVIDYGIHMVMRTREEKRKGKKPAVCTKVAIMTVGGALLLTTVTTSVGFLSNLLGDIEVIRQFGILAAVGISSSLVLMVGFLPAALQLVEKKRRRKDTSKTASKIKSKRKEKDGSTSSDASEEEGISELSKLLSISSKIADEKPWAMVMVTLLLTGVAAYGAINVDTTFNIEDFLPEGRPQSENIDYVDANYNISTSRVYVMVEGEDVGDSDFLYAIDQVEYNSRDNRYVIHEDGITSPLSVAQEYGTATIGQDHFNATLVDVFHESDTTGNEIPDRNVTELFDKLYRAPESADAMREVLSRDEDGNYEAAVLRFTENENLIAEDLNRAADMEDRLEEDAKPLENIDYDIKITGNNLVRHETTEELTNTQIQSLSLTIFIVALLLTLVFYSFEKSKILGIITTFPVTLVTLWIVGTMYMLDVPLNVLTVTITALTVGMGVDFSIHISHRFLEEIKERETLYEAMDITVKNTGGALFGSAVTTVGAFAILSASDIIPIQQFGYITATAIGYSFLVAVFLLPSGLMIWAKVTDLEERLEKEGEEKEGLPVIERREVDQDKRKSELPIINARKSWNPGPRNGGKDNLKDEEDLPLMKTRK